MKAISKEWGLGREWWADGRKRFVLFCTYYIAATYLIPSVGAIRPYSFAYFALVLPGWIYIAFSYRALLQTCNALVRLWWLFIVAALGVAVVQESIALAYNSLYLGLLAIVIINSGGYLRTQELNFLFLTCIAGSAAVYLLGLTDYGFFPGQTGSSQCDGNLGFRISLFRTPSESAALALFVLLWNVFLPPKKWRWFFILAATYYIFFSGIRTVAIALVLVSPLLILHLLPRRSLVCVGVALLIPVVAVGVLIQQLARAPGSGGAGDFFAVYLLRSGTCEQQASSRAFPATAATAGGQSGEYAAQALSNRGLSFGWLEQTFNRHCSAKYQLKLFMEQPVIGNPTVRPPPEIAPDSVGCSAASMDRYCDACVISTYWLSRGGVAGLVLVALYLATLWLSWQRGSLFGAVTLIGFGIIMQGWGVMFMPYNFVFFMLMSVVPLIRVGDSAGSQIAKMKGIS